MKQRSNEKRKKIELHTYLSYGIWDNTEINCSYTDINCFWTFGMLWKSQFQIYNL